MKHDYQNPNEGARTRQRAKRRKTNLILNSLIAIVLLLIIYVSANIFFSKDEGTADNSTKVEQNEKAGSSGTKNSSKDDSEDKSENRESADKNEDEAAEEDASKDSEEAEDNEGEPVVTEGGSDPNVKQTIENPDWKPVGTSQTGDHVAVFSENSVDWQEMIAAYSYATGIDKNNMTVWWNENNGGPNSALGTVSEKGSDQTFRVAIEWVDGEGWKPVKVEELKQNDKR
ncbi:YrrS family protein [Bacillus sp. REN3]|uniref:YrrS family protein n=1 Tax=Bacillus sp. REN3 TaxID=2802440 RepID=UPI001AED374E|nr:YrrS family protein [Bacillus sp. REN3]